MYNNRKVSLWYFSFLIIPAVAVKLRQLSSYVDTSFEIECQVNQFQCPGSIYCIYKFRWCDNSYDCSNQLDEYYCRRDQSECPFEYFTCDNGACIPDIGRCDGYPSCPDGSDEFDCGCEEMTSYTGKITYSVHTGRKRTSKCWKIVVPESKYLILKVDYVTFAKERILSESGNQNQFSYFGNQRLKSNSKIEKKSCNDASLEISWGVLNSETVKFCPGDDADSENQIKYFRDVEIRHHTKSISSTAEIFDSFKITYVIEDLQCLKPDSFKCSKTSCIPKEQKCDGVRNCYNGIDEKGCERGIFAVPGVNISRSLGLNWLKNQRNPAWGWRENTHRAIIALYLGKGANFNGTNLEEDLMAKQLELQISTAILRNETDLITPTQLAMYINALLVICHDPRNFYGFNLVNDLKNQIDFFKNKTHPLPYLALCNAKEALTDLDITKLVSVLENLPDHSFITDVQSVALMALACVENTSMTSELSAKITKATEMLKKHQNKDGSFGNIYTTSLVIQALLSFDKAEDTDWDLKAAAEFLKSRQSKDGMFENFLATYLILPILNSKSLTDIGKINCTESLKMPRDSNPVSDIEYKLGPKISIKYYLYIGDQKDQIHPLFLRIPNNSTVLEMMRLASEADTKFKFQAQNVKGKLYIYELFGITNDPEDEKFWLLYVESKNESLQLKTKSPDEVFLKDNDKIIMWFQTTEINYSHTVEIEET